MLSQHPSSCYAFAIGLAALACLPHSHAQVIEAPKAFNPVSAIARLFSPELVRAEDRQTWLENRVRYLAPHRESTLKVSLGYLGYRGKVSAADPSITLDLGKDYPINAIYLVPAQREFLDNIGNFPKRYTLEISRTEDFSQKTLIFSSATDEGTAVPARSDSFQGGTLFCKVASGFSKQARCNPIPFEISNQTARYVRMTIQEGQRTGMLDRFGLSEIFVISQGDAVSLGTKVTTVGNLNTEGIWYAQALTDGRTPLGIWSSLAEPDREMGDLVKVNDPSESVSWTVNLDHRSPLDRLILYPYQLDKSNDSSAMPESMTIFTQAEDGTEEIACQWKNPLAGSSSKTPLVIPLSGRSAKSVRIQANSPSVMGELMVYALSEIEVWSKGSNLAAKKTVSRSDATGSVKLTSLTNGSTSDRQIMKISIWLNQLVEREKIEAELALLEPVLRKLSSQGELNATWSSAIILGLSFIIPIIVVERRRLMSRDQLDQLRKRIASDLHDDIGSNLGSISLIARSARKDLNRLHGAQDVADDLGEVETIARESSLAMRDIVWLLERKEDSIGDLVQRMRETAGRLLREIHFTVDCQSSKTAAKLSLDAKRHLFLFYKEAIHNVLKHSRADNVSIRLWDEDDKLALEILDDGIGLPLNAESNPATIHKLEDRARVLDGSLKIASSKEKGTTIRLLVKRSHLIAHPSFA